MLSGVEPAVVTRAGRAFARMDMVMTDFPAQLRRDDIHRLEADRSAEARIATATKVAGQFSTAVLGDGERRIAEDIVRGLMKDVEVRVREALAAQLKDYSGLPHDMALTLARDVESVSLPMLQFSDVLTDEDLIEIVRSGSSEKQVAIAGRPMVSADLADALIDTKNEAAVARMVANPGAALDDHLLERTVAEYGHSEAVCASLTERPKLPAAISERLMGAVTEQLMSHLIEEKNLPIRAVRSLLRNARDRATISMFRDGVHDDDDLKVHIARMDTDGRLTTSLAFRALSLGDSRFFEMAMARLARLSVGAARALIHDEGDLGLEAILQAALTASRNRSRPIR